MCNFNLGFQLHLQRQKTLFISRIFQRTVYVPATVQATFPQICRATSSRHFTTRSRCTTSSHTQISSYNQSFVTFALHNPINFLSKSNKKEGINLAFLIHSKFNLPSLCGEIESSELSSPLSNVMVKSFWMLIDSETLISLWGKGWFPSWSIIHHFPTITVHNRVYCGSTHRFHWMFHQQLPLL